MKIGTRLAIYFTVLVMMLIALISGTIYTALYKYNHDRFYTRLKDKAVTKATLLFNVHELSPALLKTIDQARNDVMVNEKISVYDLKGNLLYTNNDTTGITISHDLFEKIRVKKEVLLKQGGYKIAGIFYRGPTHEAIIVAEAVDKYGESMLAQVRFILLVTFFGSIIVTYFIGRFFVSQSLNPISSIIQQVQNLSPVKKSERLPQLTQNDEIAGLVKTFNELLDRLEDAFKLEKSFMANVSHELKNPLAKIKSQIDVALIQNRENEFYRANLHSIQEDINELIDLINNLLALSRISSEQFAAKMPLRIDEVLLDARESILNDSPDRHVSINFANPPDTESQLMLNGNKNLLVTAFKNLIENACKFSDDKSASLTLTVYSNSISVVVADKGIGIAAEDIPHIFNLFYRSSSPSPVKGYGIGLALANRIFTAHGATLSVESEIGMGSSFTVKFVHKTN